VSFISDNGLDLFPYKSEAKWRNEESQAKGIGNERFEEEVDGKKISDF
jgi:hypothetical protein